MAWNYRVIKHVTQTVTGQEEWLGIHEVYYNEDGTPHSMSTNPSYPYGIHIGELSESLTNYIEATTKPILYYDGKNITELSS